MKKALSVVFWIFSVMLCLMALALLSSSALSCVLLLACAVLINPIFIEKVQLKKGLTALLRHRACLSRAWLFIRQTARLLS